MATDNPLGRVTPVVEHYSPDLLFPISRRPGRDELGYSEGALPFHGEDTWRAWEVSWLGPGGKPQVRVARFRVPCKSPNLIESKSLKLYLNSLNQAEYADEDQLRQVLQSDLSAAAGARVGVELLSPDAGELGVTRPAGVCVDGCTPAGGGDRPDDLLRSSGEPTKETLYSHLLRSLCPVTAQPDWATLVVRYRGPRIIPEGLLAYIVSFRRHQAFHEQCVERIFRDLQACCRPDELSVQALYTRRGGLDINPFRSSRPEPAPDLRGTRQ